MIDLCGNQPAPARSGNRPPALGGQGKRALT